ncbi:helix-turn-helix transcriptional regulator [Citrobacter sp. RHBSTW-00678]|uniref:helix-turn-helix transcriptional regulator n=1 Tax=Citrobacter TaxID=544 RepID=UPI0002F46EAA|nr:MULTISPECIES: helix-turn-helix transcriptional regulator [Citrobacter]MBA7794119.1 helix-turn-helix transcriptional regulator [Citrobacter sp. RHBSTW-01065]AUV26731.1 AraC family transcriptional regulator [Citrobacter freundii complex sp. CFNIH3]ELK7434910.1 helix-turn-helix transcriptional regulator [Citrobacter braakii]MBA7758175.1 helix-turn-helix transcriptional regulator [Citrobacter sp. RHBSTW-00325]MBA8058809.1 helix-turn-helix transcriptional regulator [Citrobacter sp. RHBSTW-00104]
MNLVQQLTGIIEENLNSALPVKKLANRSGYSERWLYSLFLEETGMSVAQYIRRRKLTLAASLLRHTSRPVTDISLMYDFSSLQSFSRAFRHQYRISPLQYRSANTWDMQYAQPVLYNLKLCTEFKMINIAQGNNMPVFLHKKPVTLGMDFINTINHGRLVFNKNLFQAIMSIYRPTYRMSDFIMVGEMVPSKNTDSELIYNFEELGKQKKPEKLLPDGLFASQKFSGTYEQIFEFQMYDAYTSLCKNKCILKKGPMYTLFHRNGNKSIMNAQFLIPCLKA